jgi:hypothetical protein
MSAHDTMPEQAFSTAVFTSSTTWNASVVRESLFGAAVFSPVNVDVSSNSIDPSHPYIKTIIIVKIKMPNLASVRLSLYV